MVSFFSPPEPHHDMDCKYPATRSLMVGKNIDQSNGCDLRDLSCRLRCSLLLNARLQKEHLYFFSAVDGFRAGEVGEGSLGDVAAPLGGIAAGKRG